MSGKACGKHMFPARNEYNTLIVCGQEFVNIKLTALPRDAWNRQLISLWQVRVGIVGTPGAEAIRMKKKTDSGCGKVGQK